MNDGPYNARRAKCVYCGTVLEKGEGTLRKNQFTGHIFYSCKDGCPQTPVQPSHVNTEDAIRAIAAAKIKAHHLNCTIDQYLERCKHNE